MPNITLSDIKTNDMPITFANSLDPNQRARSDSNLSPIFLFDLIIYVPSTIFQLYRDGSSWVEPVLS